MRSIFDAELLEGTYRSLSVYVRREGTWQCIAAKTTRIKEA
jgi:hypothetical protein